MYVCNLRRLKKMDSASSNKVWIHRATNSLESRKCCREDTGNGRWSCAPEDDCAGVRERRARGDSHSRLAEKNSTWAAFGVPLDLRCEPARTRFGGRCRTEINEKERQWMNKLHLKSFFTKRKFSKLITHIYVRRSDKYVQDEKYTSRKV